jgi:hypothetical protein
VNTIVHSHTLEHVNDQKEFISQLARIQKIGDAQIISFPDFDALLTSNSLNMINFEHNKFLPLNYVIELLERNGYNVKPVEYFRGHSIFIAATKVNNGNIRKPRFEKYYNTKDFTSYINSIEIKARRLNDFVGNDDFYFFGAHIFTQMLIAFGTNSLNCLGCLDNSSMKHGKRLYGTNLRILNPLGIPKPQKSVKIIGSVGVYSAEINSQLIRLGHEERNILLL